MEKKIDIQNGIIKELKGRLIDAESVTKASLEAKEQKAALEKDVIKLLSDAEVLQKVIGRKLMSWRP